MPSTLLRLAVRSLALLVLSGSVGCGGSDDAPPAPTSVSQPSRPSPPSDAIVVSATDYAFTPRTIALKAGQRATLFFRNDSATDDHDMKSDLPIADLVYSHADNDPAEQVDNAEHGTLDVDFSAGSWAQISFTPTKAGSWSFHCGEADHAERGMVGTFVVAP